MPVAGDMVSNLSSSESVTCVTARAVEIIFELFGQLRSGNQGVMLLNNTACN
jgi:hypothetical protein